MQNAEPNPPTDPMTTTTTAARKRQILNRFDTEAVQAVYLATRGTSPTASDLSRALRACGMDSTNAK